VTGQEDRSTTAPPDHAVAGSPATGGMTAWSMPRGAHSALMALLAVALAACGKLAPDRPIAYRGEYHYDKEIAYLVQVGVDAKICIEGADMTPAVQPEFAETGGITDVAVRGILSAPGRKGHEEACTYLLTDAELLGVGERREREPSQAQEPQG
jgi:hypothetical protein